MIGPLFAAAPGDYCRNYNCRTKVFRREAITNLMPESERFFVNAEMLTRSRQQGIAVEEAGERHRPRLGGSSKVSPGQKPRVLRTMSSFWWRHVVFGRGNKPEPHYSRHDSG
jgi:hypothetical protein